MAPNITCMNDATEASFIKIQRMNATILRSTQAKISRRLGMMREVDLDPNDHTFNDRHTSLHDMTA